MMRNFLGRVFAVWAIIIFIPTMLLFCIPIWATRFWKEPRRTQLFQHVSRLWMRIFFVLTGLRLRVRNRQYFEKGKHYVVVCNHNSFMDVPLTTPFIPGANKTIAKSEMARIPIFGMIYSRGSVLVNRKSEESRKQSFRDMKHVLALGLHMCIYPEGTRNKTTEPLQPFHNGAFRLALETGTDILPAVIFNTAQVLPAGKGFFFWPAKVRMEFLPPVSSTGRTMDELKQEVHEQMKNYYISHRDQ